MSRFLFAALVPTVFLIVTPAKADSLDTQFSLSMYSYATLKRTAVACNRPINEYIDYKTRMMGILGRIPNLDLIAADQQIEQHYETDARYGLVCTDDLLELYGVTKGDMAEMRLKSLSRAVDERLRQQQ